jgi:hypothetical protein
MGKQLKRYHLNRKFYLVFVLFLESLVREKRFENCPPLPREDTRLFIKISPWKRIAIGL